MKNKSYLFSALAIGALFLFALVIIKSNVIGVGLSNTAAVVSSTTTTPSTSEADLEKQILEIEQTTDYLLTKGTSTGINTELAKKENTLTLAALENRAIKISEKRQDLMVDIAKNHPKEFLRLTIGGSARAGLIPLVREKVEQDTTLSGYLEVLHSDDFEDTTHSEFKYALKQNGEKIEVIDVDPLEGQESEPVQISGYSVGNIMVLSHGHNSIIPTGNQGREALGKQRLLVLLTEMQGETSPVTVSETNQVIFSPDGPFQKYYKEQSYNRMWFAGDVYKIQLARPSDGGCGSGVELNDLDVISALQIQSIDLAKYDRVLFVPPVGHCSGIGKWDHFINGQSYKISESWVDWYSIKNALDPNVLNSALAHEIGHSLGLEHANFLLCDQSQQCVHQEYGNYFDVMGSGLGQFNAFYKEQLGWLAPTDFVNIVASGNYEINFLESFTGKKAAKIVNPLIGPLSILYLEKRDIVDGRPYIRAQRNKLLLNMPQKPSNLTSSAVRLIDMKPGTPSWDPNTDKENVSLGEGEQYSLLSEGFTISNVGPAATSTSFHIDLYTPDCRSVEPLFDVLGGHTAVAGGKTYLSVFLLNRDPVCAAPSSYTLEFANLPAGWTIEDDEGGSSGLRTDNIAPGAQGYLWTNINIPQDSPSGSYTIIYRIRNITSGTSTGRSFNLYVFQKPKILSILPEELHSGSDVTVQTNYDANARYGSIYYSLVFDGPDWFRISGDLLSGGTIQATVPTQLDNTNSWCGDPCVPRPLLPGNYNVTLYALNSHSDPYPVGIDLNLLPPSINSVSIITRVGGLEVPEKEIGSGCVTTLRTPLGVSVGGCARTVTTISVPKECQKLIPTTNAATSILSLKSSTCGSTIQNLVSGDYSLAWNRGYPIGAKSVPPIITPATAVLDASSLSFFLDFQSDAPAPIKQPFSENTSY